MTSMRAMGWCQCMQLDDVNACNGLMSVHAMGWRQCVPWVVLMHALRVDVNAYFDVMSIQVSGRYQCLHLDVNTFDWMASMRHWVKWYDVYNALHPSLRA